MKNLIFLFSLLLLTGTSLKAQEYVLFGAKGGINYTGMNSDGFQDSEMTRGYQLGLLAEIPLTLRLSVQPEILYATQGAEVEIEMLGSGPVFREYQLDYIQVPVMAKYYLLYNLSVEIGPSFNFLVDEEIPGTSNTQSGSIKTFEFGGGLGASYFFFGGFFVHARYVQGFTNILNYENIDGSAKNYGFQLGIGLTL